jgi:Ca-activated chloride channel homolog
LPRPAISRPATSRPLAFVAALILLAVFFAAPAAFAQDPLAPAPVNVPPPPGYAPPGQQTETSHRLRAEVGLVVLHVTVADAGGRLVLDLDRNNFRVFEDKTEQQVSLFSHQDIPITMGLVIDNSGSMETKRAQVNAAALTFVRTSNPQDEAFVVNFNDEYYLDTEHDFTNDANELNDALSRITIHGGTALYDAVIGSLDHLKKGHKDKRVLLVITDGDDDASRKTFDQAIQAAQQSNATIYAIGVFSEDDLKHNKGMVRHSKKVLDELTTATGGVAYYPASLDEVTPICEHVANELRQQYTLGYYPTNAAKDGTFRAVRVQVQSPHGKLSVRSRTGYYAPKASSPAD